MRRLLAALLLLAAPAGADTEDPPRQVTEVDLALVLAVDVSRSMSVDDLQIQRQGYAAALTSADVMEAIGGGFLGRIAVTYVEWSGAGWQRVVADWTLIEDAEDARTLSDTILFGASGTQRRTSISEGLMFSARRFADNPFPALRRVIDISGDGPNNQGPAVTGARDAVVAAGITINGLPLMTQDDAFAIWSIEDLDLYYRDCVIGGPGAFVVPVRHWSEFAEAVRRKLVLEISGLAAEGLTVAQMEAGDPVDCLIGERIWQERRGWDVP